MSEFLLIMTVATPLLLVALWPAGACRRSVDRLAMWAPVPAIVVVLWLEATTIDLPWLLLGSRWGLDSTSRIFLGFTAALWLAAGIFARSYLADDPRRDRYVLFHLLTLAGNLGLVVSQDSVSFLLFFTLMSLAAYGLITHDRRPESMRAGRIYIVLAVAGEIILFWAVVLAAQQTDTLYIGDMADKLAESPHRNFVTGMLLVGFGIKLGVMPLHFWLPLAHPAAPTPASAVLSGAMIKTGLLGWIRFVPVAAGPSEQWGWVCLIAGIVSALLSVLIGLTQSNPKTVLAYSSVSQMGLITIGMGAGLMVPESWPLIAVVLVVYASHHAIAKAALFLGVGVVQTAFRSRWQRMLVIFGLFIIALSLAGLPLTSGFVAKNALKDATAVMPESWTSLLGWLLPITSVTTTLLVGRFLMLVVPGRHPTHGVATAGMILPWAALVLAVVVMFVALHSDASVKPAWTSLAPKKLWSSVWPMIVAGTILLVFTQPWLRIPLRRIRVPAGDVVVPFTSVVLSIRRVSNTLAVNVLETGIRRLQQQWQRIFTVATSRVASWLEPGTGNDVATGLFIGLLAIAMLLLTML